MCHQGRFDIVVCYLEGIVGDGRVVLSGEDIETVVSWCILELRRRVLQSLPVMYNGTRISCWFRDRSY